MYSVDDDGDDDDNDDDDIDDYTSDQHDTMVATNRITVNLQKCKNMTNRRSTCAGVSHDELKPPVRAEIELRQQQQQQQHQRLHHECRRKVWYQER